MHPEGSSPLARVLYTLQYGHLRVINPNLKYGTLSDYARGRDRYYEEAGINLLAE